MIASKHRIVFLYSELAGYFLACAKELGQHPEVESVDIVHWPVNPEAPFKVGSMEHYTLHPKADLNRMKLQSLMHRIQPTAIVCSGWMDSDYNAVARSFCKRLPVVLTLDNWWTGSLKQWLAVATAPFFISRRFNRAWVPGAPQQPFAERLGFRGSKLATGFYCADPRPFQKIYEARQKRQASKKLLYIGRYLEIKGVIELWTAFAQLSEAFPEWELHCVGTGELWEERLLHPKIFHHGFKQPEELAPYIEDAACFVMPSKEEPWGVVLQEMAIAGLPLLVSDQVGAVSAFLQPGKNGEVFVLQSLPEVLRSFFSHTLEEHLSMGQKSHNLGNNNTPHHWYTKLLKII